MNKIFAPWHIGKHISHLVTAPVIYDAQGFKVAHATDTTAAHLIAAAPTLLDALELAQGRLEEDTPKWILETIDYAIAKAQGKETK